MRRGRLAVRLIIRCHRLASIGEDQVPENSLEHFQAREWLVERYCMPRLVHSQEAEVAVLANFTVLMAVHNERDVAGLSELFRVCIFELKGDSFAAEPVACVSLVFYIVDHSKYSQM